MKKDYSVALKNIEYFLNKKEFKNELSKIYKLQEALKKNNISIYKKYYSDFFSWFEKMNLARNLLKKTVLLFAIENDEFDEKKIILMLAGFITKNLDSIEKELKQQRTRTPER